MNNSYYDISLDTHDHGSHVMVKAKRGDTGRVLRITLMDGRNPYIFTKDCRVVFSAKKADGNILFNECSMNGNTVFYEFTPQTTSVVGKAACEIKVYGTGDKMLTSARFTLLVEDTVYNEGDEVEPASEVSALTALVSEATELIQTVESKLARGEFKGAKGDTGETGATGRDGYTPVLGVDYFTEKDKAEIVNAVLEALPAAEEMLRMRQQHTQSQTQEQATS